MEQARLGTSLTRLVDQEALLNFASRVLSFGDDLISMSEASRLRGCSVQNLAQLVNRGRLPSVVVAGRRLVKRDDVIRFNNEFPLNPKRITRTGTQAKPLIVPRIEWKPGPRQR